MTIAEAAWLWPPPPTGRQRPGDIQQPALAAADDEDALLHLHQDDQRLAIGHVHDLVGDDAEAVDIVRAV